MSMKIYIDGKLVGEAESITVDTQEDDTDGRIRD